MNNDDYAVSTEQLIDAAKIADGSDLVHLISILHRRGMTYAQINDAIKGRDSKAK